MNLLMLNEWLISELSTDEAAIVRETIKARHIIGQTIFCSQSIPVDGMKLEDETIAEAILDRLIHGSYQILIDDEVSIRENYGLGGGASR